MKERAMNKKKYKHLWVLLPIGNFVCLAGIIMGFVFDLNWAVLIIVALGAGLCAIEDIYGEQD